MKVWGTIFLLVSSVLGFVLSYDLAYKKIIKLIQRSDESVQLQGNIVMPPKK